MEMYARPPEGYWKGQLRRVGWFCLVAYPIMALLCWMQAAHNPEGLSIGVYFLLGALFPLILLEPADGTKGWFIYKLAYPWLFIGLCVVGALANPTRTAERWDDSPHWAVFGLVLFALVLGWMEVDVIRRWFRHRRAYLRGAVPNVLGADASNAQPPEKDET